MHCWSWPGPLSGNSSVGRSLRKPSHVSPSAWRHGGREAGRQRVEKESFRTGGQTPSHYRNPEPASRAFTGKAVLAGRFQISSCASYVSCVTSPAALAHTWLRVQGLGFWVLGVVQHVPQPWSPTARVPTWTYPSPSCLCSGFRAWPLLDNRGPPGKERWAEKTLYHKTPLKPQYTCKKRRWHGFG